MSGNCAGEVEGLITVASREDPAQVGVADRGLREQHRPARLVNQFRAQDRFEACVPRHLEEPDGSVEPVRIREGQPVLLEMITREEPVFPDSNKVIKEASDRELARA